MYRIGLVIAVFLASCTYDAPSEITCSAGDSRDGFSCVDGYWVGAVPRHDMAVTGASHDVSAPDQGVDQNSCVRPTAAEFCAALGKNCGMVTGEDDCGEARTEACGTCNPPDTCQTDNTCTCEPETDEIFCSRQGKDCGSLSANDNCGAARTVDCGTCGDGETCGEMAANVCGCPCLIDGACVAADAINPNNFCEICDPESNVSDWTIATGRACNDGDMCTENDVCDASAACAGTAKDCGGVSTDCKTGTCDNANGNCVAQPKPVGTDCTTDALTCTTQACDAAGTCQTRTANGTCLIAGTCVNNATPDPTNSCRGCDSTVSQTDWTPRNGATCDDGVACTVGDVCANSTCAGTLEGCFINNTCVANKAPQSAGSCFVCDPSNPTTYTQLPANSACPVEDSLTCTTQSCNAGGTCDTAILLTHCVINNTCVVAGTQNPQNVCQTCNPTVSQTAWSNRTNGFVCGTGTCACTDGTCQKSNGMVCN